MSYSLKQYPPLEGEYPPPPEWLLWQGINTGQVRHYETLQKAKRGIYAYGQGFYYHWRIYRWDPDEQKYIEHYRGSRHDAKEDNPLFQQRVKKQDVSRVVPAEDVDAAINSILNGARV